MMGVNFFCKQDLVNWVNINKRNEVTFWQAGENDYWLFSPYSCVRVSREGFVCVRNHYENKSGNVMRELTEASRLVKDGYKWIEEQVATGKYPVKLTKVYFGGTAGVIGQKRYHICNGQTLMTDQKYDLILSKENIKVLCGGRKGAYVNPFIVYNVFEEVVAIVAPMRDANFEEEMTKILQGMGKLSDAE